MPKTGMSVPIAVDQAGGALLDEGGDQILKLLMLALTNCESANPFQNLGLPEDIIFRINDPIVEAEVALAIENVFKTFETAKRARLVKAPEFTRRVEGELEVRIDWVDLEETRRQSNTFIIE